MTTDEPEARRERAVLLERVVRHVLEDGLAGLSVRTIARSAGCEPSVLAEHFGTRDDLVDLVLGEIGRRLRGVVGTAATEPGARLGELWGACTAPDHRPLVLVFFEAYGLSMQHPERYLAFVRGTIADWHAALTADGIDGPTAGLMVAAVQGALIDRLTGDGDGRAEATICRLERALRA